MPMSSAPNMDVISTGHVVKLVLLNLVLWASLCRIYDCRLEIADLDCMHILWRGTKLSNLKSAFCNLKSLWVWSLWGLLVRVL